MLHTVPAPKRRNRYQRLMVDYTEATFHQNEEIIKILKEIRDALKKQYSK